jgi:ComF family protein
MNIIKTINFILDLFYPRKCINCSKDLTIGETICGDCLHKWEAEKAKLCRVCRLPHVSCTCSLHLVRYDKNDDTVARKLILRAKTDNYYYLHKFFADEITELLADRLSFRDNNCGVIVVNVPRSKKSKFKHGFDQSENIAACVADNMKITHVKALKNTALKSQKTLNAAERSENAETAFALIDGKTKSVTHKNVILIDDVITSGATIDKCGKLLYSAGASEVVHVTVGKTQ